MRGGSSGRATCGKFQAGKCPSESWKQLLHCTTVFCLNHSKIEWYVKSRKQSVPKQWKLDSKHGRHGQLDFNICQADPD